MQLCGACRGITVKKLAKEPFIISLKYVHLADARELIASARQCPLCALFRNVIIDALETRNPGAQSTPIESWFLPEPLIVESEREIPYTSEPYQEGCPLLTGLVIQPPMAQNAPSLPFSRLPMDLYAEKGK
jgi:hypothetical protein